MSHIDLTVFTGFFSLQVVFGGFVSQVEINSLSKMGLLLVDVALSLVCALLLSYNYRRRKEVGETLKKCNLALGFDVPGVYLKDEVINAQTTSRFWFWMYLVGIIISMVGITIIIFSS